MSFFEELGDIKSFLDKVFSTEFDFTDMPLDHVCYRVDTVERYKELKERALKVGKILGESTIAGRTISIIKLNEPFVHMGRKLSVLELPQPKSPPDYSEGFEHVEFVTDFDQMKIKYPDLREKFYTEEISLLIKDYDGFAIKFRPDALDHS